MRVHCQGHIVSVTVTMPRAIQSVDGWMEAVVRWGVCSKGSIVSVVYILKRQRQFNYALGEQEARVSLCYRALVAHWMEELLELLAWYLVVVLICMFAEWNINR